ncbi:hypothetical protein RRG08_009351 [Elysia crispata]|uniref:PiggyBac transposable element-derived protein domain-containing protein n=1 Tax=Elysia crispata TaxID=231223 RepID=A0AAE0XVI3_9GAST|nr:hypothetical protein RRG08_009351 [Elysia crispata]
MANRKFLPSELLPKKVRLEKHHHQSAQAGNLTFCVWQDTKAMSVLSNFLDPQLRGTVNRKSGRQRQQQVEVPKALSDYQSYMMGVDLTDRMIGYYVQNHKTRKWWRLFFCVSDGYLFDELTFGVTAKRQPPILHQPRPGNQHHTVYTRRDSLYKVCHECKANGLRGKTTTSRCRVCEVPIHKNCLEDHQKLMTMQIFIQCTDITIFSLITIDFSPSSNVLSNEAMELFLCRSQAHQLTGERMFIFQNCSLTFYI